MMSASASALPARAIDFDSYRAAIERVPAEAGDESLPILVVGATVRFTSELLDFTMGNPM